MTNIVMMAFPIFVWMFFIYRDASKVGVVAIANAKEISPLHIQLYPIEELLYEVHLRMKIHGNCASITNERQ